MANLKINEKQLLIQSIFFKYLKRSASDVEIQYWMSVLSPDMSFEDVMREFEQELRYEITLSGLAIA